MWRSREGEVEEEEVWKTREEERAMRQSEGGGRVRFRPCLGPRALAVPSGVAHHLAGPCEGAPAGVRG